MTLKQTALYASHVARGARMVDFCGWELPLHYGSQLEEHLQVRRAAGVFDVSHMTIIDVEGRGARAYLRHLLAADVAALEAPGQALYACMLNHKGGVVDDLIVYYLSQDCFRVVANAATRAKDLAWMESHARNYEVALAARDDLAMLAVQGPHARAKLLSLLDADDRAIAENLGSFEAAQLSRMWVARTGYTGEDGFEIILPHAQAPTLWQDLIAVNAAPVGLGARDTLRLEAGLNLYGADMDEDTTPLECGLAWTVTLESARDFIGRAALMQQRANGIARKRVHLIIEGRSVPRAHQRVIVDNLGAGEVTSGTFSPSLKAPIALARVPAATGATCEIEIRGQRLKARVARLPFVRHRGCGR
ncbi:MAG TPA: glycine cleavage system aminomethyltransferase GcvT [Gammaproteobacteria bacterium]|nr:glycine cleavage system aminomethyltransferase GcvT [Gammaproteobacteria bacterium]